MHLSEHFHLDEFLVSETAARRGIANRPPENAIARLRQLCRSVLEPLRAHLGKPLRITSGYRSPALNRAVGGSPRSLHIEGRAADIVVPGVTPLAVCEAAKHLELPCAEIIHEFGHWAHLAVAEPGESVRLMTATRVAGKTRYREGLVDV